jgi:membrane protease YdiL (CAAX protease family)
MRTYLKDKPWLQLVAFGMLTVLIAFVVSLFGLFVVSLANHISPMQMSRLSTEDFSKPENASIAKGLLIVQFFGIFFLPSLAFAIIADPRPLAFAGLKKPDRYSYLFIAILIIFCSYFMVEWLGALNEQIVQSFLGKKAQDWIEKGENDVGGTLQNILIMKNTGDLLKSILLVGGLAAIGEELFFRGVLQRIFIQIFKKPWVGILVTAALFSAIHGQFLGFIPRMVLGIVLGYLYWYSGSLFTAMLGHFVFNSFQIVLLYLNVLNSNKQNSVSDKFLPLVGLVAMVIVIGLLFYMRKHSRTNYTQVYDTPYLGPGKELNAM